MNISEELLEAQELVLAMGRAQGAAVQRRNQLINDALKEGVSRYAVAQDLMMSQTQVKNVANATGDIAPTYKQFGPMVYALCPDCKNLFVSSAELDFAADSKAHLQTFTRLVGMYTDCMNVCGK